MPHGIMLATHYYRCTNLHIGGRNMPESKVPVLSLIWGIIEKKLYIDKIILAFIEGDKSSNLS